MVYDITNNDSFQNLEDWYRLVIKTFNKNEGLTMPYVAIVANKSDLSHMRVVRTELANRFADENGMFSFIMSAKSGDQVRYVFYRTVATPAGIPMTKPEVDAQTEVVTAQIVNHQQHDDNIHGGKLPGMPKKDKCTIS